MKVVYHPAAAAEHLDQIHHYATLAPALGSGYVEEFQAALGYIVEGVHLTIRSSRNCFAPATAWQRKLATPSPALRSSA